MYKLFRSSQLKSHIHTFLDNLFYKKKKKSRQITFEIAINFRKGTKDDSKSGFMCTSLSCLRQNLWLSVFLSLNYINKKSHLSMKRIN